MTWLPLLCSVSPPPRCSAAPPSHRRICTYPHFLVSSSSLQRIPSRTAGDCPQARFSHTHMHLSQESTVWYKWCWNLHGPDRFQRHLASPPLSMSLSIGSFHTLHTPPKSGSRRALLQNRWASDTFSLPRSPAPKRTLPRFDFP